MTRFHPSRLDVTNAILRRGSVFIHVDTHITGSIMPEYLLNSKRGHVVLNFGFDMPIPIPDMKIDELGISGTLRFKGEPYWCAIPWPCVFAVIGEDARGYVWNTPEHLQGQVGTPGALEEETVVERPLAKVFSLAEHRKKKL